jgi:hypothetical protein
MEKLDTPKASILFLLFAALLTANFNSSLASLSERVVAPRTSQAALLADRPPTTRGPATVTGCEV